MVRLTNDHILVLTQTISGGSFNTHTFFCYLLREGHAVTRVIADWGQRPGEQLILYSESGAAKQHQL